MFQFKIISSFYSEKHHHSFFRGYVKTENRTHLTVRQNMRPFKRAASRVGIRKQKNKATDIHHQHHVGLTCLSVTRSTEPQKRPAGQIISSCREDWQQDWRRSLTGRRGNIWASSSSLWRDPPGSEARRRNAQPSATGQEQSEKAKFDRIYIILSV